MSVVNWEQVGIRLVERDFRPVALVDRAGRVLRANAAFRLLVCEKSFGSAEWVAADSRADFLERLRAGGVEARQARVVLGSGTARLAAVVGLDPCGPQALLLTVHEVTDASPWATPLRPVGGVHYEVSLREGRPSRLVRRLPGGGCESDEPCWKQVFGRTSECPACPLRRLGGANEARAVVESGAGIFQVLLAERRDGDLVAMTAWRVDTDLTRQLQHARLSQLSARAGLTERETDVFVGLLRGGTHEALADELGITPRTVKYHQQNLFRKLRVQSRQELPGLLW